MPYNLGPYISQLLASLRAPEPPQGLGEAWQELPLIKEVLNMAPRISKQGPCQEIVLEGQDVDLTNWPIQTCWPGEPAPLITWPLVVTKGPGTKREDDYNLGIYRMQVTGPKGACSGSKPPGRTFCASSHRGQGTGYKDFAITNRPVGLDARGASFCPAARRRHGPSVNHPRPGRTTSTARQTARSPRSRQARDDRVGICEIVIRRT